MLTVQPSRFGTPCTYTSARTIQVKKNTSKKLQKEVIYTQKQPGCKERCGPV